MKARISIAMFALVIGASVAGWSRSHATGTDSIEVIGHLVLPGAAVTNLRVLDDSTRHMIEVTDGTNQTLNLVDVTDAARPRLVQQIRKPAHLRNARLQLAVGDSALFESSQPDPKAASRTITIVNLADPENPKTLRRFADVTSVLPDRSRGLIYVTNPEGLWVLQAFSTTDRRALEKQFDEVLRSAQSGG